jgi:anti-sigma B factor antagonist
VNDQVAELTPVIVVLPAEIDVTNAEQVSAKLGAVLAPGVALVIVDMMSTSFCDTSGIRAILRIQEQATAGGVKLRFAVASAGSVRRVLELTGIGRLLAVYASMDEAMNAS